MRTRLALSIAMATLLSSSIALADRVATVKARGGAPDAERVQIKQATEAAVKALGHTAPTDAEIMYGESAASDKIGTSQGLVAVGKITNSDWVVEATVASSVSGTHVELKACQVSTGRVESVARDLDPKGDLATQLREMLAVLLRPQGVGDDPLPWSVKKPPPPPPPPEVLPKPKPPEPEKPLVYAEGSAFAVGAGGGFLQTLARPQDATGGKTSGTWSLVALFAIPGVKNAEITARIGGLFGPASALRVEVGARYMLPLARLFSIGVGAAVGGFGTLGGSRSVRAIVGGSPLVAFTFSPRVQLDLELGAFRVAPGKEGALAFAGVDASLLVRF